MNEMKKSPADGSIQRYGMIDQIQCAAGPYKGSWKPLLSYHQGRKYLNFGIRYERSTCPDKEQPVQPVPLLFLTVETASGKAGIKTGQWIRGIEVSLDMIYMRTILLPFLGFSEDAASLLEEEMYHTSIPEDMHKLILRIEDLLWTGRMTMPLLISVCLEVLSLLLSPANQELLLGGKVQTPCYVQVGRRKIKLTGEEFRKVTLAHVWLEKNAPSFATIFELSRELGISEQKLKAGFRHRYHQTIGDYANCVRMNTAASLLYNTEDGIRDISRKVGYQSPAAFIHMFKKWWGMTPGQFRTRVHTRRELR